MRIITVNLNGIRSAAKKGFFEWMQSQHADVICIQETKAHLHQLHDAITDVPGYFSYFHDAEKKGYSGVALYCKKKPDKVKIGLGFPIADTEGRYIQADFGNLSVASLYLPSGSSSPQAQEKKFKFLAEFFPLLKKMRKSRRDYILCGDWNIAHKPIDLKNWRSNQKNSGFLPEERAWLDTLFDETGFIDAFRVVDERAEQYTWWSNRGQAWEKNVGWRIDYQITTPGIKSAVKSASIYKEQRFSDHAPLIMDYAL